jgi:hypothetical protein
MVKKKKIWLIVGCLACTIILLLIAFAYQDSTIHEKKIAQYLYADHPTEAIREIKILLFFHPKNIYGMRMRDLLTSDDISYP